ncbi:MAG: hypothetical protein LBE91_08235 [Tannerella sp.]|jgi:DNA repair photolyase|nr:hypothetical protein [Tannerella sp.]
MKEKEFNGDAIYTPKGKAAEYARWACNFHVGCPVGCLYCYNKNGRFKKVLGSNEVKLKKCFRNESHAIEVFEMELRNNLQELQKYGLFLSFTTDPMLEICLSITWAAIRICFNNQVPVIILTKCTDWMRYFKYETYSKFLEKKNKIAFGFTLTGHDELEPNASTNAERINAMRKLHEAGFKTWASIEPVIDFESSYKMIYETKLFCDHYKIGLESGKKYEKDKLIRFVENILILNQFAEILIYFKDSLLNAANIDRAELPKLCVDRDYNIFYS